MLKTKMLWTILCFVQCLCMGKAETLVTVVRTLDSADHGIQPIDWSDLD